MKQWNCTKKKIIFFVLFFRRIKRKKLHQKKSHVKREIKQMTTFKIKLIVYLLILIYILSFIYIYIYIYITQYLQKLLCLISWITQYSVFFPNKGNQFFFTLSLIQQCILPTVLLNEVLVCVTFDNFLPQVGNPVNHSLYTFFLLNVVYHQSLCDHIFKNK